MKNREPEILSVEAAKARFEKASRQYLEVLERGANDRAKERERFLKSKSDLRAALLNDL